MTVAALVMLVVLAVVMVGPLLLERLERWVTSAPVRGRDDRPPGP